MTANNDPSSAGAGRAKFSRRRLVPLIVVAVASGVVIAMGWQRQLSFETLARHYAALREFIAAHEVSAVAAYVAVYIVAVALSIPVGVYLTVAGGILFGAVLGGTAAVVGATIGAICIFLIAKSAIGEYFV
ncbi:MAG TPA: TVP38/TMEM64 family protein, partial [Xanthobacteraceae bacterium]|nr:TVP38/TMEM64 family protein [Xanthobacteraceae bacterium]